jgi:2'-5' RNA ligase
MRLFVAIEIDDAVRGRIARFLDGVREFAPNARWARSDSLHVTLKFIGEEPAEDVGGIKAALQMIAADRLEMKFRGYGFFPTARSPRVFWVGIESGAALCALAAVVEDRLASLDIPKEEHAFTPHLTLARGGSSGSPRRQKADCPNRNFQRLQEKLAALTVPEFGTMTVREFFLYQSQLSPGGSKYTKLAEFRLR